jgi:hypothetical protein
MLSAKATGASGAKVRPMAIAADRKVLFFMTRPPRRFTLRFPAITRAKHILISFPLSQAGIRLTLL